jgi:hypothetical protein
MSNRDERMIQFRIKGATANAGPRIGKETPGEVCLLRISAILCLFPEHRQIRTIEHGWTVTVYEEDWDRVEKAFRGAYLGREVHAV